MLRPIQFCTNRNYQLQFLLVRLPNFSFIVEFWQKIAQVKQGNWRLDSGNIHGSWVQIYFNRLMNFLKMCIEDPDFRKSLINYRNCIFDDAFEMAKAIKFHVSHITWFAIFRNFFLNWTNQIWKRFQLANRKSFA